MLEFDISVMTKYFFVTEGTRKKVANESHFSLMQLHNNLRSIATSQRLFGPSGVTTILDIL